MVLYKAFNKLLPPNLQRFFKTPVRTHNLRGFGHVSIPRAQTTRKCHCVSVCGVKLWNRLDLLLKQCKTIHQFKFLYKHWIWLKYRDEGL